MSTVRALGIGVAALAAACGTNSPLVPPPLATAVDSPVTISILGTNDVHGHVEQLALFAGYVRNVRAARAGDGGVVLVDGGDMFQGTLESNVGEGDVMIEAYNAIGYTAATIGNHEFDFGPAGPQPTPEHPGDDARGALKARAAQAMFPLLAANIRDSATGALVRWPNVLPSTVVDVRGVRVGIIGVTTMSTPYTTMPTNFAGLEMIELDQAIAAEAVRMRNAGIAVVIVAAHAGTKCSAFDDPTDLSVCDADDEIVRVTRALPGGAVDVIVAGHSHAGVAHRFGTTAVIESFKNARAFGRVDVVVERGRVTSTRIYPPQPMCAGAELGAEPPADCTGGFYEGAPVERDPVVAAIAERAVARAQTIRDASLGVVLADTFTAGYRSESAVGNLFVDLMLQARPDADVAITNGGGLRADLPAGELAYGTLYRAMPFDNRFAIATMTGDQLARVVAANLRGSRGIFSIAGVRATAACDGSDIRVGLARSDGSPVGAGERLRVAISDFLASGGDGALATAGIATDAIDLPGGPTIRDAIAEVLRKRGGTLAPTQFIDPQRPRLTYPDRPMTCR